jgi:hypothetical protein
MGEAVFGGAFLVAVLDVAVLGEAVFGGAFLVAVLDVAVLEGAVFGATFLVAVPDVAVLEGAVFGATFLVAVLDVAVLEEAFFGGAFSDVAAFGEGRAAVNVLEDVVDRVIPRPDRVAFIGGPSRRDRRSGPPTRSPIQPWWQRPCTATAGALPAS